ncbi:hypothetical protein [Mycoplasmopsis edwardii]|uniref:Uncharacterized protein n=1 Tax=Mycoplasmopsis edwardii TaxID=53558 RepID=A0ACD4PK64_9BACT|nr:hypothetical protein [Mycoplasmopsis edwardii]WBP84244.1 hypothetical protein Me_995_000218 [Mycoplasmopsis edwardii]
MKLVKVYQFKKVSKKIKRDLIAIKNEINLITSKHSKDLLKYQKFQCKNCFKKVTKVKVLHFLKSMVIYWIIDTQGCFKGILSYRKNENHLKSIEMILDANIINSKSKEMLKKRYQKLW